MAQEFIGKAIFGCEESQALCVAFRKKGWEAYSLDILPCSGGHPEWHLQGPLENYLDLIDSADLYVGFPPCTYVCSSGLHWNKRIAGRQEKTDEALHFICMNLNRKTPLIGMENPVGCISTRIALVDGVYVVLPEPDTKKAIKPAQTIQPWQFGHPESKATCLYLKGLPPLEPTGYADFKQYRCSVCGNNFPADMGEYGCCDKPAKPRWDNMTPTGQSNLGPSADRALLRSKTYPGIAEAMAQQWTKFYIDKMLEGL